MSEDPELEAQLHLDAWDGLTRADLVPFARLLRSSFVLNEYLAINIAEAIEGKSANCRIKARKIRRGRPGPELEVYNRRNGMIAAFVAERSGPSASEAAIREAMDQFGLGRTSITGAVRAAKKYRRGLPEMLRAFWDDRCRAALAVELKKDRC